MLALLDCNNFYVSCERLFNPRLIGKPVVVLSNNDGCVISRSNEAKSIGIKMGEPFFKIKNNILSNKVSVLSSNYSIYGDISDRIMNILKNDFPEVEVYSIDEAFFKLKGIKNREQRCVDIANKILKWTGIPVSIGIAKTKTLAKITNRVIKKRREYKNIILNNNVLEIKEDSDLEYILKNTSVENVWGVGRKLSVFLKKNNINNAFDLKDCNEYFIRKKKGVILQRTVLELRGVECNYIESSRPIKKSICVSRSFGNKLRHYESIRSALIVYVQKAASKTRLNQLFCRTITVFLKTSRYESRTYSNSKTYTLIEPTIDLRLIWKTADKLLKDIYKNSYLYSKVGIILSEFYDEKSIQQSLINNKLSQKEMGNGKKIMQLIDDINDKFGYGKLKLSSDFDKDFFSNKKTRNNRNLIWKMKSKYCSPCYTTRWYDIPKVKV